MATRAVVLGRFRLHTSRSGHQEDYQEALRLLPASASAQVRAKVLLSMARCSSHGLSHRGYAQEALELARQAGDTAAEAKAMLHLAMFDADDGQQAGPGSDALSLIGTARELAAGVEADLLPQLKLFQSIDSSLLTDLLSHYSRVNSAIHNIAKMRTLEVFGSDLELEEFSPLKHEFENPSQFGARTIRIVRPGVSVQDSGKLRIIRKALVESV